MRAGKHAASAGPNWQVVGAKKGRPDDNPRGLYWTRFEVPAEGSGRDEIARYGEAYGLARESVDEALAIDPDQARATPSSARSPWATTATSPLPRATSRRPCPCSQPTSPSSALPPPS